MNTKVKETEGTTLEALDAPQTEQPVAVIPAKTKIVQPDFMSIIDKAMTMPNFELEKLERLLEMQKQIMAKNAEMAFNSALVRLSADLPRIVRSRSVAYDIDKNNKQLGKKEAFKYAAYEDVDAALRPLLAREGFHPSFDMQPRQGDGGGAIITCTLLHVDGHSMKASVVVALDTSGGKSNIQAMGSTISYGQRYCLKMLLNIVTVGEDDDGAGAEKKSITEEQVKQLNNLLLETKSDRIKFLAFVGAATVEEITTENFDKGLKMLEHKKKTGGAPNATVTTQPKTEKKAKE